MSFANPAIQWPATRRSSTRDNDGKGGRNPHFLMKY
jgi:hypothetical protein